MIVCCQYMVFVMNYDLVSITSLKSKISLVEALEFKIYAKLCYFSFVMHQAKTIKTKTLYFMSWLVLKHVQDTCKLHLENINNK